MISFIDNAATLLSLPSAFTSKAAILIYILIILAAIIILAVVLMLREGNKNNLEYKIIGDINASGATVSASSKAGEEEEEERGVPVCHERNECDIDRKANRGS